MTQNQKKSPSIEMDPEMTEMIELTYKDVKIAITTMLKYLKKNINIRMREIEYIKKESNGKYNV